jgi:hypothetical protein
MFFLVYERGLMHTPPRARPLDWTRGSKQHAVPYKTKSVHPWLRLHSSPDNNRRQSVAVVIQGLVFPCISGGPALQYNTSGSFGI